MTRSRWMAASAACLLGAGLAACGDTGDRVEEDARSPLPTASSPAPAARTPSPSPSSSSPAEVVSANLQLSDSLGVLGGAISELEADTGLQTMRREVSAAASLGRSALTKVRNAAYPASARSCSSIASGSAAARSAATRATGAADGLSAAVTVLSTKRAKVVEAKAVVGQHLAALESALDSSGSSISISVSDVRDAIKAADIAVSTSASVSRDSTATIAQDVKSADDFAATAQGINDRLC